MRIQWQIEKADVARVRALKDEYRTHPLVRRRIECNVKRTASARITKNFVWEVHLGCLLTTQQRSGPGSTVQAFLDQDPFPLTLKQCRATRDVHDLVLRRLRRFGGIRRGPTISKQAASNLEWLESGGWKPLWAWVQALRDAPTKSRERQAARFVVENLNGFGPKQARNLWQWLGLSRHEIPLDSRILRWLNKSGYPFKLSASALADPAYYEFVLDSVQALCKAARVKPCVLDAMVFSSFDRQEADGRSRLW